ncbi:MAG TPA: helix-turn-helix domain-containing protein [Candidatus Agathobaculum pullicola]|nr:helix-turn-helix domain-containing protein [Candidatus Agathobaculum pullicola]
MATTNNELSPMAISTAECARLLGVSRPVVYRLINQDDFPSFKLGNRTLISVDGLRAWVSKQTEVVNE